MRPVAYRASLGAIALLGLACRADKDLVGPPTETGDTFGEPVTPGACVAPKGAQSAGTETLEDALGTATVSMDAREACARIYTFRSTAALRDNEPANPRVVAELAGSPTLRSGHDLLDGLYALALAETRELAVNDVTDGSFANGAPLPCGGCFQTGRLWGYVWTRDTAYAAELGMAFADPSRTRRSLEYKLSELRGGGGLQIVQDTGSGGSYPVSTDRVGWALGARAAAANLSGAERADFEARARVALINTVEHDRAVVFDEDLGLYRGEQSFLDWREQSYPEWTADEVVHLAMSASLSTNLLHMHALEYLAELSEGAGQAADATRYAGWASALRSSLRARLWVEEDGLYASYLTTALDPAPVRRYDLLGEALAITLGLATEQEAVKILASYPHYGAGAPVIWPQQQGVPIYHNRATWPFVTAYWLRAAQQAGNAAVAERAVDGLVRGAALNLSNMENLEAGSGASWLEDGDASGPVVNSQRQLWSVAGYLSLVHHTWFGLQPEADGLHVRPYITATQRAQYFSGADLIALNGVPWQGATLSVVLHLPAEAGTGALEVLGVTVDGLPLEGELLPALSAGAHRVDVMLGAGQGGPGARAERSDADWREVFGPRTPRITGLRAQGGHVVLDLARFDAEPMRWAIYRDGALVEDDLPGDTTSWVDTGVNAAGPGSPCYTAELRFEGSGNRSQHAPPSCWWGTNYERITSVYADQLVAVGGEGSSSHGRFHYEPWGDPGDSLTLTSLVPSASGEHLFQVVFGNGAGPVSSGVTAGVKWLRVERVSDGALVGEGALIMPHLGDWERWSDSNFVRVSLEQGVTYRVVIGDGVYAKNMSSFSHFEQYTGGLGGVDGVFNRVNISELKVLKH